MKYIIQLQIFINVLSDKVEYTVDHDKIIILYFTINQKCSIMIM